MSHNIILHLSDWNYQDKYYEAPFDLFLEFKKRLKENGWEDTWHWWLKQVDYSADCMNCRNKDCTLPIKFGTVNMCLDIFFLDYEAQEDCIAKWEDELEDE